MSGGEYLGGSVDPVDPARFEWFKSAITRSVREVEHPVGHPRRTAVGSDVRQADGDLRRPARRGHQRFRGGGAEDLQAFRQGLCIEDE